ncbi:MAG: insulinase family protein [Allorhizobium sp.]
MSILRFLSVLPLLLVCGVCFAAEAQWDPRLRTGQLPNGLTYVLHDSGRDSDPFNIRLIVHAGSIDEDRPSGVAHILEHMVFQSNHAYGRSMHLHFQDLGWRTGLQINAVTRETETQFMVRTRPDDALDLQQSVDLMANLVFQPAFLADDWEKERFVILEELRQTESLVDRLSRQKKAALRPLSRFVGRAPIGTRAGIEAVTISDIQAFHDRFYRASNMTLIISGRIDQDATEGFIKQSFGQAPSLPAPDRDYRILPLKDGLNVALVQEPGGTSSQVTYAIRMAMPPRRSEEGQRAYLHKYILNQVLRSAVRRLEPHYMSRVESVSAVMQEPTEERLILAFNARSLDHDRAKSVLLDLVERIRRDGVSRDDFEQAMRDARRINGNNPEAAGARTFADWEDRIASAVLMGSVLDDPKAKRARTGALLDEITFEKINADLQAYLGSPDQVMFYQVPGAHRAELPDAAALVAERESLKAMAVLPKLDQAPAPAEVAALPSWPSDAVVLDTGRVVSEAQRAAPEVTEWSLSNGDRVVWLTRPTSDGRLHISGQAAPGYMNGQIDNRVSQAALQLYTQSGLGFWSEDEWSRWSASRSQHWSIVLHDGVLDAGIVVAPTELRNALQDYAATIAFGTIREEAVEAFREDLEAGGQGLTDAKGQLLYGRGHRSLARLDPQSVEAPLLLDAAKAHLRQPVTWFVVGPAPDMAQRQAFGGIIGAVPRQADLTPDPALQLPGHHHRSQAVFEDERARVEISFFAPMDWTPEASFIVSALNPIAQQALKNELRNALGGVYSVEFEVKVDPDTNRALGSLAFNCAPERAEELTAAALRVFERMPETALGTNVERLKADIGFAEKARLEDPNTWVRRLALSYRRYGNAGYLDRMDSLGSRISGKMLAAHARHIFETENVAVFTKTPLTAGRP